MYPVFNLDPQEVVNKVLVRLLPKMRVPTLSYQQRFPTTEIQKLDSNEALVQITPYRDKHLAIPLIWQGREPLEIFDPFKVSIRGMTRSISLIMDGTEQAVSQPFAVGEAVFESKDLETLYVLLSQATGNRFTFDGTIILQDRSPLTVNLQGKWHFPQHIGYSAPVYGVQAVGTKWVYQPKSKPRLVAGKLIGFSQSGQAHIFQELIAP